MSSGILHSPDCPPDHIHGLEGCWNCPCPLTGNEVAGQEEKDRITAGLRTGLPEIVPDSSPALAFGISPAQDDHAQRHARRMAALNAAREHVRTLTARDPADRNSREIPLAAEKRLDLELRTAAFLLGEDI